MITTKLSFLLLVVLLHLAVSAPPPVQDKDVNEQRKTFTTFEVKPHETEIPKDDVQKRPVRDSEPQLNHDLSYAPVGHEHENDHENVEPKPAILPSNPQNDQPTRYFRQTVTEKHTTMQQSEESGESDEDESSEEKKEEFVNKPTNIKRDSNTQDKMEEHLETDQHHDVQNDQTHHDQKGTDEIKIEDAAQYRRKRQLLNSNKPEDQSTTPISQISTSHDVYSPQNSHLHFASPMNDNDRKTRDTEKYEHENDEKTMQGDQTKPLLNQQKPQTLEAKVDETRKTRETEVKMQGDQPKPATLPAYQKPQTLPAKLDDTIKTRDTVKQEPQNYQNKHAPDEKEYPQLTYPIPLDANRKTRETEKTSQTSGVGKVTLENDDTLLVKRLQQRDQQKIAITREREQHPQNDQPKSDPTHQRPMPLPALLDETRKVRESPAYPQKPQTLPAKLDETRKTKDTENKPQRDQPKPETLPAYLRPQTLAAKFDDTRKTRETEKEKPQADQPMPENLPAIQRPQTLQGPLDTNRKSREAEKMPHGDQPKPATLPAYQRPQTLPAKLDDTRKTRCAEKQEQQNDQNSHVPCKEHPQLTYPAPLDTNKKTRETEQTSEADHPQVAHDFLTSQKEEDDHNSKIPSYVHPPQKSINVPQGTVYRDASSFKIPADF